MANIVRWSKRADASYFKVIDYLTEEWTENEARDFAHRVGIVLKHVSENYQIYPYSRLLKVHKAVITKQVSLLYRYRNGIIQLLVFIDNRQNPDKLTKAL